MGKKLVKFSIKHGKVSKTIIAGFWAIMLYGIAKNIGVCSGLLKANDIWKDAYDKEVKKLRKTLEESLDEEQ